MECRGAGALQNIKFEASGLRVSGFSAQVPGFFAFVFLTPET
jgi:hypothetical protein